MPTSYAVAGTELQSGADGGKMPLQSFVSHKFSLVFQTFNVQKN
jgi:hypothetical protein